MKSSSSARSIPLQIKIREWSKQFGLLVRSRAPWVRRDFSGLQRDLDNYRDIARSYGGFDLLDATAFEIGCGQRPYRLCYLIASGVEAYAVDLDKVVMNMTLSDYWETMAANGLERAAKTLLRSVLFDRADNAAFRKELSRRASRRFEWPTSRIARGSAAEADTWPALPADFVYSEDVFEHIPPSVLPEICSLMHSRMSPRGIAWVKPLIFTGIQGGHAVDWYDVYEDRDRVTPPWDHLRKRKFPANTYLNTLRRADYRRLFSMHFEILEERVINPDLGQLYITPAIRSELSDYTDEDLFSNEVGFILRPIR